MRALKDTRMRKRRQNVCRDYINLTRFVKDRLLWYVGNDLCCTYCTGFSVIFIHRSHTMGERRGGGGERKENITLDIIVV